jgi:hypothetical protein
VNFNIWTKLHRRSEVWGLKLFSVFYRPIYTYIFFFPGKQLDGLSVTGLWWSFSVGMCYICFGIVLFSNCFSCYVDVETCTSILDADYSNYDRRILNRDYYVRYFHAFSVQAYFTEIESDSSWTFLCVIMLCCYSMMLKTETCGKDREKNKTKIKWVQNIVTCLSD